MKGNDVGAAGRGERFYFLGVDPALASGRKNDDGALAVLRARPKVERRGDLEENPWEGQSVSDWIVEAVWAYRLRGAGMREWSGFIHKKHAHFGFSGLLIDPGAGGGGGFLELELAKGRQLIDGIETLGIAPAGASPAYWRTLGNRLAARLPLPEYTAERHAAWLAGRALS